MRALVAFGNGDRVVHVISLYGHSGAGDSAERMRQNEKLLGDTFCSWLGWVLCSS